MKPPVYSSSLSFHHLFRNSLHPVIREWRKCIPYVQPCYAVSPLSSHQTITLMRQHRVPMICDTPAQTNAVNDYALTIESSRFGTNECIVRSLVPAPAPAPASDSPPLWVYTMISNDGVEHTRQMFEHIWANKYILKGIVFDIHNFADTSRGSIPPSMYSYKIAIDYLFRNIIHPFEKEYGIQTPCIMMDGREHVTRIDHLHELHNHAFTNNIEPVSSHLKNTELRLIVGELFDRYHK